MSATDTVVRDFTQTDVALAPGLDAVVACEMELLCTQLNGGGIFACHERATLHTQWCHLRCTKRCEAVTFLLCDRHYTMMRSVLIEMIKSGDMHPTCPNCGGASSSIDDYIVAVMTL